MAEGINSRGNDIPSQKMISRSPAIIAVVDEEGRFLEVSAATENILGYTPEELYGNKIFEFIVKEDVDRTRNAVTKIKWGRKVHDFENRYIHKEDGRVVPLEWSARWDDEDQLIYAVGRDATDIKERYNMVVRATKDAIYDWDITSNNLHWDESFKSTFGYGWGKEKYTIEEWAENVHPDDLEETRKSLDKTLNDSSQKEWEAEYRFLKKDGTYATILERGFITRNKTGEATRMIGALQDITDLKRKEQELERSLEEKETLLAEIHHRVKNNLAVVSGMIQLQAIEEEDEDFVEKLSDSITRIHSMASIHEQLYQSDSFSKLNFSENLKELVSSIIQTISVRSEIDLMFDVESIQLSVTQAIPCTLIMNEVVTNILKHGFQETKNGKIVFKLSQTADQVLLVVKDNGDGLPEDFQCRNSDSLGLHLIQKLSEQLDASYGYESLDEGTMFTLSFNKSEIESTSL